MRHHARLVTEWLVLRTALFFVRRVVRLVYAVLPEPWVSVARLLCVFRKSCGFAIAIRTIAVE
jgi:hypothetical protein